NAPHQSDQPIFIAFFGIIAGSILSLLFVFAVGLLKWAQSPVSNDRPSSPRSILRADPQIGGLRILVVGLPVLILIGLTFAHSEGIVGALAVATSFGLD